MGWYGEVLISIQLLDLIWLVFSCLFLYGSLILGQLLVTGRGLPKICKLKGAINDSCTQNRDNLDHYKLLLQRRLVQTSLFYPSVTTYTSGKCKEILDWKVQSLKISMQGWNEGLHLKFFVTFIIWHEPCVTSFHVLVFLNDKPNPPFSLSRSPASAESLNATTSAKPSQPPAVSAKHHPCLAGQAYFCSSWAALRGFKLLQVNGPFVLVTGVDIAAVIVSLSF